MKEPKESDPKDGSGSSRRAFLRTTAAAVSAGTFASQFSVLAQEARGANERIGVGFIGTGGRAGAHIDIVNRLKQQTTRKR